MGHPKSHTCALNTLGLIYCSLACSVNRSELDITRGGGRSADQVHGPSRRPGEQLPQQGRCLSISKNILELRCRSRDRLGRLGGVVLSLTLSGLKTKHFSHLTSSVNYVPIFRQPNHGSASQSQQLLQLAVFGWHSLPAVRRSSVQGVWSESDKLFMFAT